MSEVNAEFVEKYQLLYEKDPKSKVFAPLAEAYRRLGLIEEALRVAEAGVGHHPHFPSGRVALAKIQFDRNHFEEAVKHLLVAVEFSPENILAHSLLAETYLKLKDLKKALKYFKMVLFLNPSDSKAQKYVQKLESLTADEFSQELFDLASSRRPPELASPLRPAPVKHIPEILQRQRVLERAVSLSDAYLVRNDVDRAAAAILEAEKELGAHPELEKRKTLIQRRRGDSLTSRAQDQSNHWEKLRDRKVKMLKSLLVRVSSRANES